MGKIEVRIYSDGYVQVETKEIKGKKCSDYEDLIKRLLNDRIVEKNYTEEFYEEERVLEEECVEYEKQY